MSDAPRNMPFALFGWINEHVDEFTPPVANKVIWRDADFIAMVVRGPNARNDFHIDPRDELFWQLRGDIRVDLIDSGGERREHIVREGEMMLVEAFTPHAPMRPADTWGLVIERPRAADELDTLRWYCDRCDEPIHEMSFHLDDIESALASALDRFNNDRDLRTCGRCRYVMSVAEPFTW